MQSLLSDIVQQVQVLRGKGQVANYIPALAEVSPHHFGIAVYDISGQIFKAGDADIPFSIQSISKLLSLTLAIEIYGETLWERVGREPSGQAFNSIIELERKQGIPRNPFINAGALQVCDMLQSRYAAPKQRIKELAWQLSGNQGIHGNTTVAASEMQFGARSAAMAHLMKAFDNFSNPVDTVLDTYFHACSLEMSCVDLAKAVSFLANHGRSVVDQKQVVSPRQSKQINALLATCGLYDEAGEFAYRVGLPGKSGVGGGIVAVIPGELSICVWSPELNPSGNSLAGCKALELFTTSLGKSIF
jgi:glutaminase